MAKKTNKTSSKDNKNLPTTRKKKDLALTPLQKPGRGLEEFDERDFIIPYAKMMQPLSPELEDESLKVKKGNIINSLTQYNYGSELIFIPLMLRKRRIKWVPLKEGGGMDCGSINAKVPDVGSLHANTCAACEFSKWTRDDLFKGVPPECDLLLVYPAIVVGIKDQQNKLIAVSFMKTSYKAGQKLANIAKLSGGDLFSRPYKLTTVLQENELGKFYVFVAKPAGILKKDELKEAEMWYNTIESMKDRIQYHEENIDADDDDRSTPF